MVGGIHICQNNKCCHTNALYTTIQGKNSNIYSNITANLEEPQCMPIMQTLVNLFYLSLMTDTLQVMLRKMETLEENQQEALLCRRLQGRHTEEVQVMDLQVAQTQPIQNKPGK